MLADLLPSTVSVVETVTELAEADRFEVEARVVERAVAKRRDEFFSGRACARAALRGLGVPAGPIPPGPRGAPEWPAGVVGSITHCDGYRGAAVAWRRDVLTIGVDGEPDRPVPGDVLELVALDTEQAMVRDLLATRPGPCWDKLLFCAKEAVYKAWFPLMRTWLDFSAARITIDPSRGTFDAELLVPSPVPRFTGRWCATGGLLLTAIVVPGEPADRGGPS
jgi:4'-phosphopantetheinyl transferase EntD